MKLPDMRHKLMTDTLWLERAMLALDAAGAWEEADLAHGPKIADFLPGTRMVSDFWSGRARELAVKHLRTLAELAVHKALAAGDTAKADALQAELDS